MKKLTTPKEIKAWLNNMHIKNYTINSDLTIDVNETVFLKECNLTHFPVNFNKINGHFNCSHNQLISLEGAPKIVKSFSCENNQLTNLVGGPEIVDFGYECSNNQLTSLKGCAQKLLYLNCSKNQLTHLEFAPQYVGLLTCKENKITSFKGLEKTKISDGVIANNNQITNLEGLPFNIKALNIVNNPLTDIHSLPNYTQLIELYMPDFFNKDKMLDFQYDYKHKIYQYFEKIKAYYEKIELEQKLDNPLIISHNNNKNKL